MEKPTLLITRSIFEDILADLSDRFNVIHWDQNTPPSHDWILQNIPAAHALFTMLSDKIDEEIIEAGVKNKLKVISQMAVGFDNISIQTATKYKIPVGHTPGVLTETTADFAWALMMAAARRVVESHTMVQNGIWRPWGPSVLCGVDIYGSTLGVIGFGRIGQAMAKRAAGFNMEVLFYDPLVSEKDHNIQASKVTIEELLDKSDFISLHAYLSPETKGLIGKNQLSLMKRNAILINTARGAMIDIDALVEALQSNKIAGAAMDVFDPEPIPPNHPLLKMPNVIITPHIASATTATRHRMAKMTVENIDAGLSGKRIPYCANPGIYTG